MTKELLDRDDVRLLVDAFYAHVREDELLSPVFNAVIEDRWPGHLEKMYDFWETVLFGAPAYKGSPFPKHARLPIAGPHFDRWIKLFVQTLNDHFHGKKAEEAKWRAEKMAEMFQQKLDYFNKHPDHFIS